MNSEKSRLITLVIMGLVAMTILVISANRPVWSYDSFWHLRMGQDFIQNGLSPWVDHYSFTYLGQAIETTPYIFQSLLYGFVNIFGVQAGFAGFKIFAFGSLMALVLVWLHKVRAPIPVICSAILMIVLLLQLRNFARPELLSYTFSLIALLLTNRSLAPHQMRATAPLVLLMWVWSNYHMPIFGYIILFGWFVDYAIEYWKTQASTRVWLAWCAAGLSVVLVGFLTPSGTHPLMTLLTFAPQWKIYIAEYQVPLIYETSYGFYLLVIIAAATLVLLVMQRRIGTLIIWFVLTYNALLTARLVTPGGIILVCLFAQATSSLRWRETWPQLPLALRRSVIGIALISACAPLPTSWEIMRASMQSIKYANPIQPDPARYPSDVVAYMQRNKLGGKIFNELHTGGYLVYALRPSSSVYIDGRTEILYPYEHFQRSENAKKSPTAMRTELENYAVDYAVLTYATTNQYIMHLTDLMTLDFVGKGFSLYRRGTGKLRWLGALLVRPGCWSELPPNRLAQEIAHIQKNLPEESKLRPFANLVLDYDTAADKEKFLATVRAKQGWDDSNYRFLGFMSLKHGLLERSYQSFLRLKVREPMDFLAMTYALIAQQRYTDAEQLAEIATRANWLHVTPRDLVTMRMVLRDLAAHAALTKIPEVFVTDLDNELSRVGITAVTDPLNAASFSFCRTANAR